MLQRVLGEQPEGLTRVTDLLRRAAATAAWEGRAIYGGLRPPQRIAGVYNIGGGPHFGSGLTVDTAAELYATKE